MNLYNGSITIVMWNKYFKQVLLNMFHLDASKIWKEGKKRGGKKGKGKRIKRTGD